MRCHPSRGGSFGPDGIRPAGPLGSGSPPSAPRWETGTGTWDQVASTDFPDLAAHGPQGPGRSEEADQKSKKLNHWYGVSRQVRSSEAA